MTGDGAEVPDYGIYKDRDWPNQDKGQAAMITRMDGCLLAYSLIDWGKLENRILSLAAKSEAMRQFRRWFVGGAHECTFDKQGRVLIPPDLRGYAQLDKEIQTVGVLDHFEIWSQDKWAEEQERIHANMQQPEVRNEIAELGI